MADDGMPFVPLAANPKGRSFSSPAVQHQVRRADTLQFRSIDGTTRMAGVPSHRLRRLIAKEITDNALDACDRAGCPGMASIERQGDRTIVTDQGAGIDGGPTILADLFSTGRAMLSAKYWRMPTRGVLGNGLRVMVAAVALSDGTITVETRGRRTVLHPRRITGMTDIGEQTLSDVTTGTRITYTLDATIPHDVHDLADASAAITLAQSAGPPYARRPSPHWLDLDHLVETFHTIEPADTTVRQLIEQLDGCTGATAGKLAAPFGKGCLCRDMTEPEIARLLAAMQAAAREVKARSLGTIGADAFGDAFDAYIVAETALRTGARQPHAVCPVLIEAWASVTSRKGGNARLRVFCNRTPAVGNVSATRALGNRIELSGIGLEGTSFDAEGGNCDLILAVTAPMIPQVSLGKAPVLHVIGDDIAEALRRAFVKSRNRLPADPKQPKPPKHEPPPKPPRPPPYQPTGPLAMRLAAEAEAAGIKPADLLVLSPNHDPFNETKAMRRAAVWFAEQVELLAPPGPVHLRGMYYRILAKSDVRLPDGSRFVGNADTAQLIEDAGKYARHFGLIPFERIVDERAAPPVFYDTEGARADPGDVQERILTLLGGGAASDAAAGSMVSLPQATTLLPWLAASPVVMPRQSRVRLCVIGEKTSLSAVLRPIASEVGAELLLETGEISESHAYGIAARAAQDGRPLRVLYFADFDPAGWQMSVSLARKLMAHRVREFPDLDFRLIRVALTIDQVRQFDLPDSPIKPGEKRARAWRRKWGREQVEIDALAALQPATLAEIARNALAPYFDFTLPQRFARAERAAEVPTADLAAWLERQPAYQAAQQSITVAHAEAQALVDVLNRKAADFNRSVAAFNSGPVAAFNAVVADNIDAVRKAFDEATDKPDLPPVEIAPDFAPETDDAVFDSRDPFIDATRKLQRIKRDYMTGDDDSDT
jgi:DNA topoisomerase VI subunit B